MINIAKINAPPGIKNINNSGIAFKISKNWSFTFFVSSVLSGFENDLIRSKNNSLLSTISIPTQLYVCKKAGIKVFLKNKYNFGIFF